VRVAALAALAFAVACSGGDGPSGPQMPPDPDPSTPTDVSFEEAMGELNAVNNYAAAGMTTMGMGASGTLAPAPAVWPCPYDAPTRYFVCPDQSTNGVTVSQRYQIISSGGVPMSLFDPLVVGGIRNVVDVDGTLDLSPEGDGSTTLTIDSHADHVLSGLQTTTRTVNGSGTAHLTLTTEGQTINVTTSHTITNLVLPAEFGPNAYPVSGSITTTASAPQASFSATLTFNGTSTVTIVTVLNGQSQSCTYDLATPETPPVCQ
jgi:hypothetical protein